MRERIAKKKERMANMRERIAKKRERMANMRERIAKKRERMANMRERIAKKRDKIANMRERMAKKRDKIAPFPAGKAIIVKIPPVNLIQFRSISVSMDFCKIICRRKRYIRVSVISQHSPKRYLMKVISLALSFINLTDMAFLKLCQYVVECMTGNTAFPTPVPTLEAVTDAINDYSEKLIASAGKDLVMVAEKNQSRLFLESMMAKLGLYVMFTAMGDEAALKSSGFPVVKERTTRYITNTGNVTLTNGVTSGQMQSRVKSQKAARSYQHQITDSEPADNTVWDIRTVSTCKYVFSGLTPGKRYWVRVAVVGSADQIAYSPVASMYAQ
jgi:hypothetical protein